tara:strand:+ start:1380 stop:1544 length:165 start_codon:yes stop_codon:yes gene_type:complete
VLRERAARRAHVKRVGEAALEAALGQRADTVACLDGLGGDAFLREGGIEVDPRN